MRMLKHEEGFIVIESIGAMTIVDDYGRHSRVFVEIEGKTVALLAPSKDSLKRKIDAVIKIMMSAENKGNGIHIWEDL